MGHPACGTASDSLLHSLAPLVAGLVEVPPGREHSGAEQLASHPVADLVRPVGPGQLADPQMLARGVEQLQETSWSVAVSREISSPVNGGTATRSGPGKKPNRGGSARGRATTPPGQNAKPSRRGSLGGGISGRRGTACRAPASSGHAQASSVRGVRPGSAGTHTEDATKLAAGAAKAAPPPPSPPQGGAGASLAPDTAPAP